MRGCAREAICCEGWPAFGGAGDGCFDVAVGGAFSCDSFVASLGVAVCFATGSACEWFSVTADRFAWFVAASVDAAWTISSAGSAFATWSGCVVAADCSDSSEDFEPVGSGFPHSGQNSASRSRIEAPQDAQRREISGSIIHWSIANCRFVNRCDGPQNFG